MKKTCSEEKELSENGIVKQSKRRNAQKGEDEIVEIEIVTKVKEN